MAYPKPLSKNSICRMYKEIGLTEKQIVFLRDFFTACANLYGIIMAEDAWNVYRELSSKTATVPLHRKDMYAALSILRRETTSFFVFEVFEVFSEEEQADKYRMVVLRDLIPGGYRKFAYVYDVLDNSVRKSYFVPLNFLDYVVMPQSRFEQELLQILENLQSTQRYYKNRWGSVHQCNYVGKFLKDFSYINEHQDYELRRLRGEFEGAKGNMEKAARYEAELNSLSAAQYLVQNLKRNASIGHFSYAENIEFFFDDLNAMGVKLEGLKQTNVILSAVNEMLNNLHHWCNRGWTPKELSSFMQKSATPTMSFGADLHRAFDDGTISKEEVVRKLKELGIKVTD